jgi:hypothetical protein
MAVPTVVVIAAITAGSIDLVRSGKSTVMMWIAHARNASSENTDINAMVQTESRLVVSKINSSSNQGRSASGKGCE